jgi:micrococcal nuclease
MAPSRAALLVALLALAGCVSVDLPPATEGDSRQATVTRVIDGDTVNVRYAEGGGDTVRLLGVDSPELDGRNDPTEFEGVPNTEAGDRCLLAVAHEATAFAERHLAGATVAVVVDETADRRDRYDRLLAYVVLPDGTNFNYRLVESGNARVYDSTFARSGRFYAAEARAQAERRGLWACRDPTAALGEADSTLRVAAVHADAAGDDATNLGDEYVTLRNAGNRSLDLSGWTVGDEAGHVYAFPDGFSMEPGATVTIYTGAGVDTADSLYWSATAAIWNNDGDVVVVRNETGAVVARYAY